MCGKITKIMQGNEPIYMYGNMDLFFFCGGFQIRKKIKFLEDNSLNIPLQFGSIRQILEKNINMYKFTNDDKDLT